MDNIISDEEQSKTTSVVSGNYLSALFCRSRSQPSNDSIEAMNEIKTKVLDDTFTTDWRI
jgi:HAE1 family hydrophobic/amphiphilic exporter-1/multidrug efflux pump